jgi:phage I-like protein
VSTTKIETNSDSSPFLVDLALVVLSDSADESARIPLVMIGTFYKGKQKFSITKADVVSMAENFAKRGTGDVVLDYEHASEDPEVAQGGPVPAAGWITSIDSAPDANGIVWGSVQFTQKARDMVAAKEYKYISPVINWGVRDRTTGDVQGATLTSAALTNRPVLDRMPAIRLSDAGWSMQKEGAKQNVAEKQKCECGEALMCPKCDAAQVKKLAASEVEQFTSRVIALSDVKRDNAGRIDVAGLDKNALVPVTVIQAIETERIALSEVADAVKAGKITPAQKPFFEKMALSDVANFREIVKTLGQQVDLSEHGLGGSGAEGGASELTKIDQRIDELAQVKVKADGLPYQDAIKLVASEHPELNRRRTQLARAAVRGIDEE